jgi:hypothetical protein
MKKRLLFLFSITVAISAQAEVRFTCGGGRQLPVGREADTISISRDRHEYLIHAHAEFDTGAPDTHHTEFGTFVGEPSDFIFTPTAFVSDSTGAEVVKRASNAQPYRVRLVSGPDGWITLEKRRMTPLGPHDLVVEGIQCKQGVSVAEENAALLFLMARKKGLLVP